MSHIDVADIDKLIETAARLFAENGFEGVGIRQLSEESGIKTSSIFYHFGTKAALYDEVLEHKYNSAIDVISKAAGSLTDPQEKLECILGTLFDVLLKDRVLLLLLQRNVTDTVARKGRAMDEEGSVLIELASKLIEGEFRNAEDRRVAFSLGSLILGFCGLTAAMIENSTSRREGTDWYAEQRDEMVSVMVAVGKRVRLLL